MPVSPSLSVEYFDKSEVQSLFGRHPALAVVQTPGKGRGLVVTEAVSAGTVMETAPVLPILPVRQEHNPSAGNQVYDYTFAWEQAPYDEAIVLGLTSLCNHSPEPTCKLQRDYDNIAMRIVTTRDLSAGEDVTLDYQCPLWFDYIK